MWRVLQSYIVNGILNIVFAGFLFVQLPTHIAGILMICSGIMYFIAAFRKEGKAKELDLFGVLTTRFPARTQCRSRSSKSTRRFEDVNATDCNPRVTLSSFGGSISASILRMAVSTVHSDAAFAVGQKSSKAAAAGPK
jgi:hypothetical protein